MMLKMLARQLGAAAIVGLLALAACDSRSASPPSDSKMPSGAEKKVIHYKCANPGCPKEKTAAYGAAPPTC